jgi:hypothetical protein
VSRLVGSEMCIRDSCWHPNGERRRQGCYLFDEFGIARKNAEYGIDILESFEGRWI